MDLTPIPNWENSYSITRKGQVWSHRWKRWLKATPDQGYISVWLSDDWERKKYFIHILLLLTFVGPRPEGYLGLHKDDNKTNNDLDNLEWGTVQKNVHQAIQNGKWNASSQYTNEQVLEVKRLHSMDKLGPYEISRRLSIPITAIHCWVCGRSRQGIQLSNED